MKIDAKNTYTLLDRALFFTIVEPTRNESIQGYNKGYSFGTKAYYTYGSYCGFYIGIEDDAPETVTLTTFAHGGMTSLVFDETSPEEEDNAEEKQMMLTCLQLVRELKDKGAIA